MTTPFRHRTGLRGARLAITAIAAAALVATLAACSATASSTEPSSSDSATRTVETAKGSIEIPARPQRVVSVHSWTTESSFDLGVTPVAVEDSGEQYVPQRYLDRWKAAPKISSGAEVDLEAIAALKPDLIVGVDVPYLDKLYEKLSEIAPTAFTPFGGSWQDYSTQTAEFLNANDKLAELKSDYSDRIAEIKEKHADVLASATFAVIQGGFDEGNYWIYGKDSAVGAILTELGAKLSTASAAVKADETNSVSYEQTDLLADADYIVYYTNNDGTPANNIEKLFALQSFTQLKAATADHLVGTADFLPGSYSDGLGVLDSIDEALGK